MLLYLFLFCRYVQAFGTYSLTLVPYETFCFFENLNEGDKFELSFEVSDGGRLDTDFWVTMLIG